MKQLDFGLIGQRIRQVRIEKKLTQEFLAEKTGVNVSHISNVENSKVKVSLTLLVAICDTLGVTIDYILENEYHTPTSTMEKELMNIVKDLEKTKKEQLLRIAKVL